MAKARKTNIEFIVDAMEFSAYGALSQAFIMEAVSKYAEQVAASKPEDFPKNGFIQPEVWISVGKELQAKLRLHYGNSTMPPAKKPMTITDLEDAIASGEKELEGAIAAKKMTMLVAFGAYEAWDVEKFKDFKKTYAVAVKDKRSKFGFHGNVLYTNYAAYIVEYLDGLPKFKGV